MRPMHILHLTSALLTLPLYYYLQSSSQMISVFWLADDHPKHTISFISSVHVWVSCLLLKCTYMVTFFSKYFFSAEIMIKFLFCSLGSTQYLSCPFSSPHLSATDSLPLLLPSWFHKGLFPQSLELLPLLPSLELFFSPLFSATGSLISFSFFLFFFLSL